MNARVAVTLTLISFLLAGFQNCSDVGFAGSESTGSLGDGTPNGTLPPPSPTPNPNPNPNPNPQNVTEQFDARTRESVSQTDLLFVVDDSVSMGTILDTMKKGFAALSVSNYPADTLMAVTNMAPAKYIDASINAIDFTASFYTDKPQFARQPGFQKLVTKAGIDAFLASDPTYAAKFPLAGCTNEWFAPSARNANGQSCLEAHTQTALMATIAEAGTVTLSQLMRKNTLSGIRTFRDGSLASIVFVSDTHDAGVATYYGKPGAPAAMWTYEQLLAQILENSPGIRGVKMSGIVPLPPAGHPKLAGVKTVGALPASLDKSKVSSEDVHDFSYLPYIAASGGAAMHPVGNDWTGPLGQLIDEFKKPLNPVVTTQKPIAEVVQITVNGMTIGADRYQILPDRRHIQFLPADTWADDIRIVVEYRPQ